MTLLDTGSGLMAIHVSPTNGATWPLRVTISSSATDYLRRLQAKRGHVVLELTGCTAPGLVRVWPQADDAPARNAVVVGTVCGCPVYAARNHLAASPHTVLVIDIRPGPAGSVLASRPESEAERQEREYCPARRRRS